MSFAEYLTDIKNPSVFWGVLLLANILMFLFTVVISYIWSSLYGHEKLPIERKDVVLSIVILMINVVIAIPGYLLFTYSKITFTDTHFVRDFLILFFIVDFLMYVFHYASHYIWPFTILHGEHHRHHNFNEISLYVMHPAETILFGFVLTIIPYCISLNFYSFLVFLMFNWLIGVISHLNTSSTKSPLLFGNNIFHKNHHEHAVCNFGFYTVIWDRLFKTYYPKKT